MAIRYRGKHITHVHNMCGMYVCVCVFECAILKILRANTCGVLSVHQPNINLLDTCVHLRCVCRCNSETSYVYLCLKRITIS